MGNQNGTFHSMPWLGRIIGLSACLISAGVFGLMVAAGVQALRAVLP